MAGFLFERKQMSGGLLGMVARDTRDLPFRKRHERKLRFVPIRGQTEVSSIRNDAPGTKKENAISNGDDPDGPHCEKRIGDGQYMAMRVVFTQREINLDDFDEPGVSRFFTYRNDALDSRL